MPKTHSHSHSPLLPCTPLFPRVLWCTTPPHPNFGHANPHMFCGRAGWQMVRPGGSDSPSKGRQRQRREGASRHLSPHPVLGAPCSTGGRPCVCICPRSHHHLSLMRPSTSVWLHQGGRCLLPSSQRAALLPSWGEEPPSERQISKCVIQGSLPSSLLDFILIIWYNCCKLI